MRQRLHADLSLMFCSLVWGVTFVVVKNALDHASPFVFLAVRFSIAVILMAFLRPAVIQRIENQEVFAGMRLAFFMFAGYCFQTAGLQYTSASNSGFVTGFESWRCSDVYRSGILCRAHHSRRGVLARTFRFGAQPDSSRRLRRNGLALDGCCRGDSLAAHALRMELAAAARNFDLRGVCNGGRVHGATLGAAVHVSRSRRYLVCPGAGVCGHYLLLCSS